MEDKKKDERVISEIKEFKMSEHNNGVVGGGQVVADPYLSFFKLVRFWFYLVGAVWEIELEAFQLGIWGWSKLHVWLVLQERSAILRMAEGGTSCPGGQDK